MVGTPLPSCTWGHPTLLHVGTPLPSCTWGHPYPLAHGNTPTLLHVGTPYPLARGDTPTLLHMVRTPLPSCTWGHPTLLHVVGTHYLSFGRDNSTHKPNPKGQYLQDDHICAYRQATANMLVTSQLRVTFTTQGDIHNSGCSANTKGEEWVVVELRELREKRSDSGAGFMLWRFRHLNMQGTQHVLFHHTHLQTHTEICIFIYTHHTPTYLPTQICIYTHNPPTLTHIQVHPLLPSTTFIDTQRDSHCPEVLRVMMPLGRHRRRNTKWPPSTAVWRTPPACSLQT